MLRIVSYNTRGSLGMDQVRSTPRIIETLRPLSADLICLQEIHRRLPWSGAEDQPEALGIGLGRKFTFQSNVRFGYGGYGIGIASRVQPAEIKRHLLPGAGEQRGVLETGIPNIAGFRSINILCTHWGLDADSRRLQAEAILEILKTVRMPYLLCGDFNEQAGDPGLNILLGSGLLADADAGCRRLTFPSDTPTVRIDYILHSPDLQCVNFEVLSSAASDHCPILAEFERAS